MSTLTAVRQQKAQTTLKKQPILSKLLALYTALGKLKTHSNTLKEENMVLRLQNERLTQNCALMEEQVLQLREIVTIQANEQMQLKKTITEAKSKEKY